MHPNDVTKVPLSTLIAAVEEIAATGDPRAEHRLQALLQMEVEGRDSIIPRLACRPLFADTHPQPA
jgi:hypothetical protein